MSEIKNSVSFTMGYTNTDFKRTYKIDGISSAAIPLVEGKIDAINASLTAGTDGGLSSFFLADDYDASQNIGTLKKIESAVITSVEEIAIFGGDF